MSKFMLFLVVLASGSLSFGSNRSGAVTPLAQIGTFKPTVEELDEQRLQARKTFHENRWIPEKSPVISDAQDQLDSIVLSFLWRAYWQDKSQINPLLEILKIGRQGTNISSVASQKAWQVLALDQSLQLPWMLEKICEEYPEYRELIQQRWQTEKELHKLYSSNEKN